MFCAWFDVEANNSKFQLPDCNTVISGTPIGVKKLCKNDAELVTFRTIVVVFPGKVPLILNSLLNSLGVPE